MKNHTIDDLKKMDGPSLLSVIDYWKEYNKDNVLLANAELTRRDWEIPSYLNIRNDAFCIKYQFKDIEEGLSILFSSGEYGSYKDFFDIEKEKNINNKKEIQTKLNSVIIDPYKLVSAGKSLKNIVILMVFAVIGVFFTALVVFNSQDIKLIKNCYIFLFFLYFISFILVLHLLNSAGNHLKNSVIENQLPNQ